MRRGEDSRAGRTMHAPRFDFSRPTPPPEFEADLEAELVRCGDIKAALVALGSSDFLREARRTFDTSETNRLTIDALDRFLLRYHFADGTSLLEHFLDSCIGLSESEQEMVRGWADYVEGIFHIVGHAEDHVILLNLIDELEYRARSNAGTALLAQLTDGDFVVSRLVPYKGDWLFSGRMQLLPAEAEQALLVEAARAAQKQPRRRFRNPDILETAREMQRRDHESFTRHFGSDEVITSGRELNDTMHGFMKMRERERRQRLGLPLALPDSLPSMNLPDSLLAADEVGIIYDLEWGLGYYMYYGQFKRTFADPNLLANIDNKEVVLGYLESPGIDPLPILRAAAHSPAGASQVISELFDLPDFRWQDDGEKFLRALKPAAYATPRLPYHLPLSEKLARALQSQK